MKPTDQTHPLEIKAEPEESIGTRDFLRIAAGSTALGFGCVGAAVAALRLGSDGISFQFGVWTLPAFVVGAVLGFACWKLADKGRTGAAIAFSLLAIAGLGAFFYPLRFIPRDRLAEIAAGLAVAACTVSAGGLAIWRIARYFDRESAEGGDS